LNCTLPELRYRGHLHNVRFFLAVMLVLVLPNSLSARSLDVQVRAPQTTSLSVALGQVEHISGYGILGVFSRDQAEAPIRQLSPNITVRAELEAIARQTSSDLTFRDDLIVLTPRLYMLMPSLPVSGTWEGGRYFSTPDTLEKVWVWGQPQASSASSFVDSLSDRQIASMCDQSQIQGATLSPLQASALRSLIRAVAPPVDGRLPVSDTIVSLAPVPWFAAHHYSGLAWLAHNREVLQASSVCHKNHKYINLHAITALDALPKLTLDLGILQDLCIPISHVLPNHVVIAEFNHVAIASLADALSLCSECPSAAAHRQAALTPGVLPLAARPEVVPVINVVCSDFPSAARHALWHRFSRGASPAMVLRIQTASADIRLLLFSDEVRAIPGVSYSCGVSALMALSKAVHMETTESARLALARDWPSSTMSMVEMMSGGKRIGLQLTAVAATPEELCAQCPCILYTTPEHFIVLISETAKDATIVDQEGPPTKITIDELLKEYGGYALVFSNRLAIR